MLSNITSQSEALSLLFWISEGIKMSKIIVLMVASLVASTFISGCSTDAQVASRNLSQESGMFQLNRRVVFYNGITDTYVLTIQGRCQVEHAEKLAVTCKIGENQYKKHYLGLSDNVTYFVEQLESADVSVYYYKVIFKPQSIVPDVDFHAGE
jgi:hypothetical protein